MKNEDQPIGKRRKPMKIRTIIAATCAALAFPMADPIYAYDSQAQTVTKNFEAAIPNIPGKSLVALEVDYAPGAIHSSPTTPARQSRQSCSLSSSSTLMVTL